MFGWCNDQLCIILGPSKVYGYYFVSFKPDDDVRCLYAEPLQCHSLVYVIDVNRMCVLEHGNMFSYMVWVRDGFNSYFVPCWRVRRNSKPFSLSNYHKMRLKNSYSVPKLARCRKPLQRRFASLKIENA